MSLQLDRYTIGEYIFPDKHAIAKYQLATNNSTQESYILKSYFPRNIEEQNKVNNEIVMNSRAQISNGVVKLLSSCQSSTVDEETRHPLTKVHILMQYISTNLRDIISERKSKNKYFTKEELEKHLRQLLKTLAEMQEANITHGRVEVEKIFQANPDGDLLLGDFSDSQNRFGFDQSEIVPLNLSQIQAPKFPDKESLEALINGQSQLNINYYKIDVFSLGIVACQMATLNLYSGLSHFRKEEQNAKIFIKAQYGQGMAELVNQLLAPRATRKDFIQIWSEIDIIFGKSHPHPQQFIETSKKLYIEEAQRNIQEQDEELDVPITKSRIVSRIIEGVTNPNSHIQSDSEQINDNSIEAEHEIIRQTRSSIKQVLTFSEFIQRAKALDKLKWVELKQIKMGDFIGEGSRSKVYNCDVLPNRNCCVAKKHYANDNNQLFDILHALNQLNSLEIKYAMKVEYFNIAPIAGDDLKSELIVVQKRKKYNLKTLLDSYILGLKAKLNISLQIVRILIELHANNVIHGALKPQNILLDQNQNVFLTDFGYSEISKNGNESWMCTSRFFEPVYSSPEQFKDCQVCQNSDVWSLGMIFQEFIAETKLSKELIEYFGLYDPKREGCLNLQSPGSRGFFVPFSRLVSEMTQFKPERRIKLAEIEQLINQLQGSIRNDRFNQRKEYMNQVPPTEHVHKHQVSQQKQNVLCQYQNPAYQRDERPVYQPRPPISRRQS